MRNTFKKKKFTFLKKFGFFKTFAFFTYFPSDYAMEIRFYIIKTIGVLIFYQFFIKKISFFLGFHTKNKLFHQRI